MIFRRRKSIFLIILLFLSILILILGLYFSQKKKDEFLEYIPRESIFYLKLNLDSHFKFCLTEDICFFPERTDPLQKWLAKNPKRYNILKWFQQEIYKSLPNGLDFEKEILPLIVNETIIIGLSDDYNFEPAIILKVNDRNKLVEVLNKLKKPLAIEKNIDYQGYQISRIVSEVENLDRFIYYFFKDDKFVLAFKEKSIQEIIKAKEGLIDSLADKRKEESLRGKPTNQDVILGKDAFLTGYLNLTNLQDYLWRNKLLENSHILSVLFETYKNLNELDFYSQFLEDKLNLTFYSNILSLEFESENIEKNLGNLINLILSDRFYNYKFNFALIGYNLKQTVLEILTQLKKSDPPVNQYIKAIETNIKDTYQLDFEQDFLAPLENNVVWLVFDNQSILLPDKSFVKNLVYQFKDLIPSLISGKSKHLLILDEQEDTYWQELERMIQNFLAFKLPQTKEKVLPDGTHVIELIAQPDDFSFQRRSLANYSIKFIQEPKINFDFAYSIIGNKIILSNSLRLLETILTVLPKDNLIGLNFSEGTTSFYFPLGKAFLQNYGLQGFWFDDRSDKEKCLVKIIFD